MHIQLIFPPDVGFVEPFYSAKFKPPDLLWGFPLGLGYLASVLRENNFEVSILDACFNSMSIEDILEQIKQHQPDLIGISSLTQTLRSSLAISEKIKQYNSNLRVILGGPHVTFDYRSLLGFDFIDYVVLGEAEFTFLELCQRIRDNKPINDIRGLAYRDKGEVKANLFRPLIDNLDSLPLPARDLVEFQKYIQSYGVLEKSVDVMSSRGCTNCCVFCSSASLFGQWRTRSPENIIHEIEVLIQKYPIIKSINFLDDSFTADKSRVIRLCKLLIDHKLARFDWVCLSRVDQLDEEVIEAMKYAGCVRVHLGIESGSETILKNINKRISLSSAKNTVKLLSKAGIESYSFFMVGHPGETKETINSTRMASKEIKSTYSSFFVSQIFPGTGLEQLQPVECWAEYIYKPEIQHPSIFTHPCVPNYIPKGFTRETLKKICSALTKELIIIQFVRNIRYFVMQFLTKPISLLKFTVNLII